jgi:putative SOS response-associated peptidase YedK
VTSDSTETSPRETQDFQVENDQGSSFPWRDNFNLSPGHDAVVFTLGQNGAIEMDRKIWGLVPKGGMPSAPLPLGPSKHFANLMFNARSDTLFSKPTFSRLLNEGKTCVVAFDGFFEWKTDPVGGGKGKKQPYFVFRNKEGSDHDNSPRDYLLLAGLWTSVSTGYSETVKPRYFHSFNNGSLRASLLVTFANAGMYMGREPGHGMAPKTDTATTSTTRHWCKTKPQIALAVACRNDPNEFYEIPQPRCNQGIAQTENCQILFCRCSFQNRIPIQRAKEFEHKTSSFGQDSG